MTGIDGQVDMRLIFGIIVAKKKGRLEKEDKVHYNIIICLHF